MLNFLQQVSETTPTAQFIIGEGPVFCRFVIPCQILLPPIKRVGSSVFPATPTPQHDFTIQLGSSTITPSASVRNLGVIFDDQLTSKEHIAKTARSCRFALHNIRKIRLILTQHAAQLLVQDLVISRLDYCNALLAGLPSNTIKPLQMIQNAAA